MSVSGHHLMAKFHSGSCINSAQTKCLLNPRLTHNSNISRSISVIKSNHSLATNFKLKK